MCCQLPIRFIWADKILTNPVVHCCPPLVSYFVRCPIVFWFLYVGVHGSPLFRNSLVLREFGYRSIAWTLSVMKLSMETMLFDKSTTTQSSIYLLVDSKYWTVATWPVSLSLSLWFHLWSRPTNLLIVTSYPVSYSEWTVVIVMAMLKLAILSNLVLMNSSARANTIRPETIVINVLHFTRMHLGDLPMNRMLTNVKVSRVLPPNNAFQTLDRFQKLDDGERANNFLCYCL